jgi:hypothetical protein
MTNIDNKWIYCFKTKCLTLNNLTDKKNNNDYAVYKIGKTTQKFEKRMKQHEEYLIYPVLIKKKVYDCDTIEKSIISALDKSDKIIKRKNISDCKINSKYGLEYYEGYKNDILDIVNFYTSSKYQDETTLKMDEDLICTICNKSFNSKQGINQHISKMHKDKKPYDSIKKKQTVVDKKEKKISEDILKIAKDVKKMKEPLIKKIKSISEKFSKKMKEKMKENLIKKDSGVLKKSISEKMKEFLIKKDSGVLKKSILEEFPKKMKEKLIKKRKKSHNSLSTSIDDNRIKKKKKSLSTISKLLRSLTKLKIN